ncbi:MAG TPA: phosphate ABC transporter permease PstA [Epsilonproteobacteria bacterium]|nr:phosphate ABC transporter permease PstA [Campylobacterota bacterium]
MKNDYFYIPQIEKRNAKAKRFHILVSSAIITTMAFLFFFLFTIIKEGIPAFKQSYIQVDIEITQELVENPYAINATLDKDIAKFISRSWTRSLPSQIEKNPDWIGKTVSLSALTNADVDQYLKGNNHKLSQDQQQKLDKMYEDGIIEFKFNKIFFTTGDSKIPENAGFFSAMVGSVLTMLVTMLIAVPIGLMTAIYLEEFAPDNKFTQFIEININNLAAIPSILFGLLGLAIFINFFGVPRSTPFVGGLTLALMSLPIIIVSAKAALKTVPESIRQAGIGLGLTKWQITRDHVFPLALPGMLTGSIIALAQALGETAPLIIVGMIAFVPDASTSIFNAATVMPAQIYTWSGMPEGMYIEKTSAAIMLLLGVLLSLNAIAIYLRKKFQPKW